MLELIAWLYDQIDQTDCEPLRQAHRDILDRHTPAQLDLPWNPDNWSCDGCGVDTECCPGGVCPDVLSLANAYRHLPGLREEWFLPGYEQEWCQQARRGRNA